MDEMIAPLLTTEWGRRTGFLIAIAGFIFLFAAIIYTPLTWYNDYHLVHEVIAEPITAAHLADQTAALMQIPQRHLLGNPNVSSQAVPITSLQWRLIGVIKSTSKEASRVIISEAGRPGKVYQIGDTLSGGITITDITEEGVILNNGGHLEKLPLQRVPLMFQEPSKESLLGN